MKMPEVGQTIATPKGVGIVEIIHSEKNVYLIKFKDESVTFPLDRLRYLTPFTRDSRCPSAGEPVVTHNINSGVVVIHGHDEAGLLREIEVRNEHNIVTSFAPEQVSFLTKFGEEPEVIGIQEISVRQLLDLLSGGIHEGKREHQPSREYRGYFVHHTLEGFFVTINKDGDMPDKHLHKGYFPTSNNAIAFIDGLKLSPTETGPTFTLEKEKEPDFHEELINLIIKHGIDKDNDMPAEAIADYLNDCFGAFTSAHHNCVTKKPAAPVKPVSMHDYFNGKA